MRVENLVTVVFTQDELLEAMVGLLSCEVNDLVAGTPEHTKRERIFNHLQDEKTYTRVEMHDNEYHLISDGETLAEEF